MAIVAVDSSGIVTSPPVYFVAARLKRKEGQITNQQHRVLHLSRELHDEYIDVAQNWRLKLSAVLVYNVLTCLIKVEDRVVMDVDFNSLTQQKLVVSYVHKLCETFYYKDRVQKPAISFKNDCDDDVFVAHTKTRNARYKDPEFKPNVNLTGRLLTEQFQVLAKIH